ncbi:MAG: hypothetical protein E7162_00675 [Firmicutes bacterium]|nr:hypothetical protein [Bacillota bacterium]
MDNNLNVPNTSFENQNNNVNFNQQPINQNVPNNLGSPEKKNNTTLIIVIVAVIAVICIVAALVVPGMLDKDKDDKKDDKEVVEKEDKEDEEDTTKLYAFSEYKNYKFKMDMVMVADGMEIKTSSTGTADVTHSTDYMETVATVMGYSATTYSYSDYTNGYTYSSEDKITWETDTTTGTESINLDDIINKINSNSSDVTVLSDNHYSVKIDYESGDMSYSDVYADVYVTDGYVSKLSYDLTSVVASEGFTKFTIDIQITDFNAAGDVTIPENIKKEASSV